MLALAEHNGSGCMLLAFHHAPLSGVWQGTDFFGSSQATRFAGRGAHQQVRVSRTAEAPERWSAERACSNVA